MEQHISTLLKTTKADFGWSYTKIRQTTHINETTMSKHFNGTRPVSLPDLRQYCKCFGFNFEEIQSKYLLDAIDICKKGTLKKIIASVAGVATGAIVYKVIDDNCNKT
jgi:hypothetical protein